MELLIAHIAKCCTIKEDLNMLEIGITGGIATGKSSVANYIREKGYPVLDADVISREIVEPGSSTLHALELQFGPQIINQDGSLNRQLLGSIVFGDTQKIDQLNAIMHPKINQILIQQAQKLFNDGHELVFLEIPLLFETNNAAGVDKTIVVTVEPEEQQIRLMKRNHLTLLEARQRIKAQMPLDQKVQMADYVVENDRLDRMHAKVDHIISELKN